MAREAGRFDNRLMSRQGAPSAMSRGQRLARKAWQLLHQDSTRSIELAREALQAAQAQDDVAGQAWARLATGFHLLYFGTPAEAAVELAAARTHFEGLN